MRALLLAAVLLAPAAWAQTSACGTNDAIPIVKGQEYKAFTTAINQQTACMHELLDRIKVLEHDNGLALNVLNQHVDFYRDQACRSNKKISGWVSNLPGVEPLPLGSYTCPDPMPTTVLVPGKIIFADEVP